MNKWTQHQIHNEPLLETCDECNSFLLFGEKLICTKCNKVQKSFDIQQISDTLILVKVNHS